MRTTVRLDPDVVALIGAERALTGGSFRHAITSAAPPVRTSRDQAPPGLPFSAAYSCSPFAPRLRRHTDSSQRAGTLASPVKGDQTMHEIRELITGLHEKIGEVIYESPDFTVTQRELDVFAALTENIDPMH